MSWEMFIDISDYTVSISHCGSISVCFMYLSLLIDLFIIKKWYSISINTFALESTLAQY